MGQGRTLDVNLENIGRGHLFGLVKTRYSNLDFPASFEGNQVRVPVTLDTRGLDRGTYQGDIVVDSSGGEIHVPFTFTVHRKRSWAPALHVVFWGLSGMISGHLLRSLPFVQGAPSRAAWNWLSPGFDWGSWDERWAISVVFGVCLWCVLMMLVLAEATRRRSFSVLASGALASTTLGVLAAASGTQLLLAGDLALRPLMSELVHNWAAGGWMFAGTIIGACYGTTRRWRDLFTTRIVQILAGWLLTIFLLYTLMAAAILPARHAFTQSMVQYMRSK
jgi:hypothetical protein